MSGEETGTQADAMTVNGPAEVITTASFLEGPAVAPDGTLYFSDIRANRLWSWNAIFGLRVLRDDAGRANGNAFDGDGRLITCEGAQQGPGGRRRIVSTDLRDGSVRVIASYYNGRRFNSPNDLTVDGAGNIYFTDPRYGSDRSDLELDCEGVYRIDPQGHVERILSQPDIQRPNGIALSSDGSTLYLVDSNEEVGGNRKIWSFDVDADGHLSHQRTAFDFAPGRGADGIKVDTQDRIWACAGVNRPRFSSETDVFPAGVYVIDPHRGEIVGSIAIPLDLVTNCCFGGVDRSVVFVTAGHTVFAIPTSSHGVDLVGIRRTD